MSNAAALRTTKERAERSEESEKETILGSYNALWKKPLPGRLQKVIDSPFIVGLHVGPK